MAFSAFLVGDILVVYRRGTQRRLSRFDASTVDVFRDDSPQYPDALVTKISTCYRGTKQGIEFGARNSLLIMYSCSGEFRRNFIFQYLTYVETEAELGWSLVLYGKERKEREMLQSYDVYSLHSAM